VPGVRGWVQDAGIGRGWRHVLNCGEQIAAVPGCWDPGVEVLTKDLANEGAMCACGIWFQWFGIRRFVPALSTLEGGCSETPTRGRRLSFVHVVSQFRGSWASAQIRSLLGSCVRAQPAD